MPPYSGLSYKRLPGLRVIMALLFLIVLAMPMSGLYLFRIYEKELARQTETELIAQAALVGAMFKEEALKLGGPGYGRRLSGLKNQGAQSPFRLMLPRLDPSEDTIVGGNLRYRPSLYEPDPIGQQVALKLEGILGEAARSTLSSVSILDYHGLVLGGRRGQGLSLSENMEISEALSGNYYSLMRARERVRKGSISSLERGAAYRVFFAMPVMNGDRLLGVIHLSRTPQEVVKALYQQEARNLILAALLTVGLTALICLISSVVIVAPVKRLALEAMRVAEGRGGFSQESHKPQKHIIVVRELAELRAVVADMAEKLRRRSDYLKAFAAGVSHEFKTPLTSIKGAMELISEHGSAMNAATRERFEANIKYDLERLEKLVGRLLALARAEAVDPAGDEETEAVSLIQKLISHYAAQNFTVELADDSPTALNLSVSAEVLETVLRNLIDNSRESGASTLRFSITCETRRAQIKTVDNGGGIPPNVAANIFQPFFTTRKNSGGSGLGLSLARTLLAPYRGDLRWVGNAPGAVFVLTLPRA